MSPTLPKLSIAQALLVVVALTLILGGGAYAAGNLGKNSVGPKQLRKNSVTSAKVKDGSLKARDFAAGQLPQGAKGEPGSKGPQGPPGMSHGYEATGSVNYESFSSSLYGSTVVSLPVPAGSYFVTAAVEAQTVNAVESEVQCRLIDGIGGPESTWATSGSQTVRKDSSVDNFTLSALFDVTSGQSLNLQCSKSVPGSSARVPEANIVAIQISDVKHNVG